MNKPNADSPKGSRSPDGHGNVLAKAARRAVGRGLRIYGEALQQNWASKKSCLFRGIKRCKMAKGVFFFLTVLLIVP